MGLQTQKPFNTAFDNSSAPPNRSSIWGNAKWGAARQDLGRQIWGPIQRSWIRRQIGSRRDQRAAQMESSNCADPIFYYRSTLYVFRSGPSELYPMPWDLAIFAYICHCPLPIEISHQRGIKQTFISLEHAFYEKARQMNSKGFLYSLAWILRHRKGSDSQKREDFILFWRFFMVFAWFLYSYALEGVPRHLGVKWCGFERGLVAKEGFMPYKGKPRPMRWFLYIWRETMQRNESLCIWKMVRGVNEGSCWVSDKLSNSQGCIWLFFS